jgi:hypothetical protein
MKIIRQSFGVIFACALFAQAALQAGEPAADKPLYTILFTAESHAALLPCDCPLQPLGGVARRATLIKRYRERGPVLLVDAGGWAAGGIYDEDSDGDPRRDALRTELMAQAMSLMNYDFVCATNAETKSMRGTFFSPGAETEHFLAAGTEKVRLPIAFKTQEKEIRLWTAQAPPKSPDASPLGLSILISRLGEDETSRVAIGLKDEALVINAGRKSSQREWWRSGGATVANFNFQSQRLGVAEVFPAPAGSGRKFDVRVRMEPLSAEIADDVQVASLLAPHLQTLKKKGKQRVDVEFWTMPECPGCNMARPDIQRLATELGSRVNVALHFVVSKDDGKFASLHGERELKEAGIQSIVQKYYPEKVWAWLDWRDQHRDAPWEEGAAHLGLLTARIRGALALGEDQAMLEADYNLMFRRRVDSTPALVLANRLYDGQFERLHILGAVCGLLDDPKMPACKDVPACFFDAQCRKRGFVGHCVDAGKPGARCDTSRAAVRVPATVIVDRENVYDNHERLMEVIAGDLPGIEYRVLDISDPAARALVEKAKISKLPAYLLDPVAKTEVDYADSIGKVATENKEPGLLVVKPFAVGAHRLVARPRLKGRADLFVSRFSKSGQEALEAALDFLQSAGTQAPEIVIHDVLYWRESGEGRRELAATNGIAEVEEAARAAAVRKLYPEKLNAYFIERGKKRGSGWWDAPLKAVGIDPAKIRELSEGPSDEIAKALGAEADFLKSLEAGGEIVLLAENCEVVPIRSRKDLREILEKISAKK